jgi:hypothetical protein
MIENEPLESPPHHDTRVRLVVEVVLFQLKLAADGIRDLLLMPVSIIAAIAGLVAGGEHPEMYFRKVQNFGRKSEHWLNLFGHRRRGNTADELVRPLEETLLAQIRSGGRLDRGAKQINQILDNVNEKQKRTNRPAPEDRDV